MAAKQIVGRTKEDITTLPRWARQRIERLTGEVEHWKAKALSASSPDKTNITINDGLDERGLPPDSRVRFRLARTAIEVGLRPASTGPVLEVRSLDGSLAVFPQVSNVIYVKVNDR
jgi:hypothetical protein